MLNVAANPGNKNLEDVPPSLEKKFYVSGDDRISVWCPRKSDVWLKHGKVCRFYVKQGHLEQIIEKTSKHIHSDMDGTLVMYTYFYDFIIRMVDPELINEDGLYFINRNVDLKSLAEQTVNATRTWQKLAPKLNIIWTLPSPLDFFGINSYLAGKLYQETLSEREVRASFRSKIHFIEYLNTLKFYLWSFQEVKLLDLKPLHNVNINEITSGIYFEVGDRLHLDHLRNKLADGLFSSEEYAQALQKSLVSVLEKSFSSDSPVANEQNPENVDFVNSSICEILNDLEAQVKADSSLISNEPIDENFEEMACSEDITDIEKREQSSDLDIKVVSNNLPLNSEALLAKYYRTVPHNMKEFFENGKVCYIGLQYILDVCDVSPTGVTTHCHECILCNKKLGCSTSLKDHLSSVGHNFNVYKLHAPVQMKNYASTSDVRYLPRPARIIIKALKIKFVNMFNYRPAVCSQSEATIARQDILANLNDNASFPVFNEVTKMKPLPDTGSYNHVSTAIENVTVAEEKKSGQISNADLDKNTSDKLIEVVVAGSDWVEPLLSIECTVSTLKKDVFCEQYTQLDEFFSRITQRLTNSVDILIIAPLLSEFLEPSSKEKEISFRPPNIAAIKDVIIIAHKKWKILYPNLTVVVMLPYYFNIDEHNRKATGNKQSNSNPKINNAEFITALSQFRTELMSTGIKLFNTGELECMKLHVGLKLSVTEMNMLWHQLELFIQTQLIQNSITSAQKRPLSDLAETSVKPEKKIRMEQLNE